jgi:AP-3 complex subunit delta-1
VSATVNVITELSRKSNPKNFLPLAPQLFELLTTSSNNWMLIKIVKLVSAYFNAKSVRELTIAFKRSLLL